MSWLSSFTGSNNREIPNPVTPENEVKTEETKGTSQVKRNWDSFDSTGLERAAKAAKDLERAKYAKEALDLARIQENTKQTEYQTKLKDNECYLEKLKNDRIIVEQEQRRRTLEAETEQYKKRADYQDYLARKRQDEELKLKEAHNKRLLDKQEDSVRKQEEMRKATIDYKARLKKENDLEVIKTKVQAQGKMRRENHDIEMEATKTKLSEYRTTILETLKTGSDIVSTGFSGFINNPYQIGIVCGTILGMSLGLKSIKSGVQVTTNYVESLLGKPSLIRETSRFNSKQIFQQLKSKLTKTEEEHSKVMRGIFLDKNVEEQLIRASISTINTKRNNGVYRNLLFYGPPGTGKTLFAKSMAQTVGMDYAIMTGGDVAPLGKEAVTSIHNVFRWASTSKKGLLLFIDEADAFLKKRNREKISEDMRNALNAFLYHTGDPSKNFMLVLATNQPDQLDRAINDRVDELIKFTLPSSEERRKLLKHYFEKYIKNEQNIQIEQVVFDDEENLIEILVKETSGLSGREISKLVVAWQASAYASTNGILTKSMIMDRTKEMKNQHTVKQNWEELPDGSTNHGYTN